jgi:outer membrane protein assembly factor BamB
MNWKLLTLCLTSPFAIHAADWPQFRGADCNGISAESAPTALNPNVGWKADLPGKGLSSPIIIGDRVFVTCSGGLKQQKLHVLCFNAADGSKRWERQFWATGRTMCHEKTSVAAPTPASDGRHIVALFSSSDVVCLDLDGNLQWFRGLGRDYPNASHSLGMASSPVIADGVVLAQVENESESFSAGLDLRTGINRWKLDRPKKANWTSPIVVGESGKNLFAIQSSKGLIAVEPATGKLVWEFNEGTSTIPSSTQSAGVLYVPSGGLTAIQPAKGGERPKQLWKSSQLRPGTASPIVVGDKILILNDGGILTCGNAATGQRAWQLRLKGPISATPVAAGNFLYCVSEKGIAQIVDITKPEGEVINELDLAEKILGTPSIGGGAIYLRSDTRLWKFGKS